MYPVKLHPVFSKGRHTRASVQCSFSVVYTLFRKSSSLATALIQQTLPAEFASLTDQEADDRIASARAALADRVVILGHHYQRDEIIKYADFTGDSYKLCLHAKARPQADYIVFCGVHFMAESADILAQDHQRVILPNLTAGCSMADMATYPQVEDMWATFQDLGVAEATIPVTYMNSSAAIKSFTGEHGGAICTSSNAARIIPWALDKGQKMVFLPDEHLGRNTCLAMGYTDKDMVVWDPTISPEMNDLEVVKSRPIILWKGFCSVHGRFSVEQIERARADYPGIKVIVHPECRREVVEAADDYGSTEKITKVITESPAGSKWAVGTEINLVHRLAKQQPDKFVFCLDPIVCPCSTMYRIQPTYLAWALGNLADGRVVNEITVSEKDKKWASLALDRMLELSA